MDLTSGEIKIVDIDGVKFEVNSKYKKSELEMFTKGKNIIESCQTYEQLESAIKYSDLIKENYIGAGNALGYLIELQKQIIETLLSSFVEETQQ